jgi:hypothetical protein
MEAGVVSFDSWVREGIGGCSSESCQFTPARL